MALSIFEKKNCSKLISFHIQVSPKGSYAGLCSLIPSQVKKGSRERNPGKPYLQSHSKLPCAEIKGHIKRQELQLYKKQNVMFLCHPFYSN